VRGQYLSCGRLTLIHIVPEWLVFVHEARLGSTQREPVRLLKALKARPTMVMRDG
jgi:hypothetical protein